ncbi:MULTISPECIES: phage tail tape measure protein [Clostridium]|uniref:phage tail tape measure protein n=1 Tax=Clostridium TaxID=1485 RepID=UPI000773D57C|nr:MULTISPECIES: phage tail tape measure protein [Clostridium]AVQ53778.1 phage tail tape measure protein [Clostridium botulinum]
MADGSIVIDTRIDSSGAEKGIGRLNSIARTGMKATGVAIAATGAALVGMGAFAIKAGIDFESAFTGVKKTVDGTDEQFAQLEKAIRNMAKSMPESASEIAGVAEAAGQLGIKVENIEGFTKSMVMLGDSTNMSSEEAATALARLANITQMPQTQFDRLGSVIVALGNNLATTESEITAMGLRLAGAGHQVGMSEAQIMSFAGALSSVGIEAEAGGSAFSKVMIDMQLAVEKGGERLNQFAKIAGMSSSEFQKAFKEDAAGAIIAFIQGLGKCQESGTSAIKVLDDMDIKEVRLRDALLRASGASGVFTDALKLGTKAWDENTALTKEAETRYATMESQLEMLKHSLTDLGISFYKEVNSPMAEIVKTSKDMVNQLGKAFEKGGLDGFVTELGNVLAVAVTNIANAAPKIVAGAKNLLLAFLNSIKANAPAISSGVVQTLTTLNLAIIDVFTGLVDTIPTLLSNMFNSMGRIAPTYIPQIIQSLVNIITTLISHIPEFINAGLNLLQGVATGMLSAIPMLIQAVPQIINSLLQAFFSLLPQVLNVGVQLITQVVNGIVQMIPNLIAMIPQIINLIITSLQENLPTLLENIINAILQIIQCIVDNLPLLVECITQVIQTIVTFFIENLPQIIQLGITLLTTLIEGIIQALPQLIEMIPTIILTIVDILTQNLPAIISAAIAIMLALINGLIQALPQLIDMLPMIIEQITSTLIAHLPEIISAGIKILIALAKGIIQAIPHLVGQLPKIILAIVQGILALIGSILTLGFKLIVALAKGLISGIGHLVGRLPEIINAIKNHFSNVDWGQVGINILKGIAAGFLPGMGCVIDAAKNAAGKIKNAFCDFFDIHSPSRLMRDLVGKNIIKGIGVGVDIETPNLQRDIDNNLKLLTDKMQATVYQEQARTSRAMTAGSKTINNTKTITNHNDNGITQHVTIVNPERTPSENARALKKVGRDLAFG